MDLFSDDLRINDLNLATRLFRESRAGFLQLFNNSPVCMSMTTTNLGKRVYRRVNQKFIEKFEFSEDEIIGRSSVEVGILDQQESLRVGAIIQEKGRLQNDYVKCITKSGKIVHTVSSIEMMDMNEETYLVSFFVDVTKIVEQQAIIEHHAQQLEAVNKELEAFSYSVSHDLRAPLRAINGYTKILEEDYESLFDEEGKKALAVVQHNATKMSNLIDDLLSFAKLGKRDLVKTELDMNQLLQEIVSDLQKDGYANATINVAPLMSSRGDYGLIKQVFINLVSNALKYSSKKEHPLIEITSEPKDNLVIYKVKDNGEGFDMKYYDKLFGVFQRLHKEEDFEGTGVGLATVQRIINKHGGTVSAEAELGNGATFLVALPV